MEIPPKLISGIAVTASFFGLWFALASLLGIPLNCGLASLGMLFAILGVLGQLAWWSDRYGAWTTLGPILLIGLIMFGIALLFVNSASPVCFQ